MSRIILVAHAKGEEDLAEELAAPLRKEGYDVITEKTVLVGDSFTEEAQKILSARGGVVVCGTAKAIGTKWTRNIVNARAAKGSFLLFVVQMEEDADVEQLAFDRKVAAWWQNPAQATEQLLNALRTYYPLKESPDQDHSTPDIERRYRELALKSYDIIDLGNLPEDRHLATQQLELRRLYVPLRVRVEVANDTEFDELKIEAMEKRRLLQRSEESKAEEIPIGQRIGPAKRLIVLGDPGAGKSTVLRWIATAYLLRLNQDLEWRDLPAVSTLPDLEWLPVMIRCRELDDASIHGSLEEILQQTLRKLEIEDNEAPALRKLIRRRLEQGEAVLLIDGLDEIQNPSARATFCQQIERICVAHPKASVLVTSRIVGYREMGYRIGRGFEHVTVADLSKDDKDDFARRWCHLTERDPQRKLAAAEELIRDIHSIDRIERLTGNPMLLTTMALVKRKVGLLPRRRVDLYREAVQVLLNWRSPLDPPIDAREALPQLEYIGYAMCDRGVQQIREDEIIELLTRMREEYPSLHDLKNHSAAEFLRMLERRTGILVETGRVRHLGFEAPVFEFRHLSFQEYLAALALVHRRFPGRDRSSSLAQDIAPLAGRMVSLRAELDDEDAVVENWRDALRLCVTCCPDDDVDAILEAIVGPDRSKSGPTRARAVLAALCLADEPNCSERQALAVLRRFAAQLGLNDGLFSGTTAGSAVEELSGSRWMQDLRSALLDEFCNTQSMQAGQALGRSVMALVPTDREQKKAWLAEVVSRLSSTSPAEAIDAAFIVSQPFLFLGLSYPTEQTTKLLLAMLLRSSPERLSAAWALMKASGFRKLDPAADIGPVFQLISSFHSDRKLVALLCQTIGTAAAFGQIRDPRAVAVLTGRLSDSDPSVRRAVAGALGQIKDAQAMVPLIERLSDSDLSVRRAVAGALGQIKDAQAIVPLIERLSDSDAGVRSAVAGALGQIKDAQAMGPLIERLSDFDAAVRSAAARALGQIKDAEAMGPLIERLSDSDAGVRSAAAGALGQIKDLQAMVPLIERLSDSDAGVRSAVAGALGHMENTQAVTPLIERLADSAGDVSSAAAEALGRIGGPKLAQRCSNF